jgi:hypothetical protein
MRPEFARVAVLSLLAGVGAADGQERHRHALGEFESRATANGVLIVAPHGTFDANSGPIAIEAARLAGAGHVVASRFVVDKVRINVNRPTEGAFQGCAQEARSERAQDVYEAYSARVANAAGGKPLRLYVEVHGNSNPKTAQNIEVATTGIDAAAARAIKDAYPEMLAKVRAAVPGFPELALVIEPVDRITYTATCAKKHGIFTREFAPRGVHFEFPRSARDFDAAKGSARLIAEVVRRLSDKL